MASVAPTVTTISVMRVQLATQERAVELRQRIDQARMALAARILVQVLDDGLLRRVLMKSGAAKFGKP